MNIKKKKNYPAKLIVFETYGIQTDLKKNTDTSYYLRTWSSL